MDATEIIGLLVNYLSSQGRYNEAETALDRVNPDWV